MVTLKFFILMIISLFIYQTENNIPCLLFCLSNQYKPKTIYIYGHKYPDLDTISSSIIMADFLQRTDNKNNNYLPCRLGELNPETKYILNYFNFKEPELIENLSGADKIILLDHNDLSQSLPLKKGKKMKIMKIIDHHSMTYETENKLIKHLNKIKTQNQNFTTPNYIFEKTGSTSTIIFDLYKKNNIIIPKNIAGLMMSAIISDTMILQSKRTTNKDKEAVKELSEIIGEDYKNFGKKIFEESCKIIKEMSEKELVLYDMKKYQEGNKIFYISSLDVTEPKDIFNKKNKIIEEMNIFMDKTKSEFLIMIVNNIFDLDRAYLIVPDRCIKIIEDALGLKIENNFILTDKYPGRFSLPPSFYKYFKSK